MNHSSLPVLENGKFEIFAPPPPTPTRLGVAFLVLDCTAIANGVSLVTANFHKLNGKLLQTHITGAFRASHRAPLSFMIIITLLRDDVLYENNLIIALGAAVHSHNRRLALSGCARMHTVYFIKFNNTFCAVSISRIHSRTHGRIYAVNVISQIDCIPMEHLTHSLSLRRWDGCVERHEEFLMWIWCKWENRWHL